MASAGCTGQVRRERPIAQDHDLRAFMVGYRDGRLEAFDGLYAALARQVYAYLLSLTRDVHRAQDLAQESFLRIHRARHTYDPGLPVRPWVFGIVRHVFLMDRRARARAGSRTADVGELSDLPVPPAVESFADRERLQRALAMLGAARREALLLHHVCGLSFREIGKMLGIREAAAKLRSSRAMGDLRRILAGRGASPEQRGLGARGRNEQPRGPISTRAASPGSSR